MTPALNSRFSTSAYIVSCLGILALTACAALAADAPNTSGGSYRPHDPLNDRAFQRFYNLDYDHAIQDFEQVLAKNPNDPFAINHLITAVLIRELYHMGAMNTGEYATNSFIGQPHHPADPKAKERIKQLVDRAEGIEEQRLKQNPRDIDLLYARGVTRAQFSVYTALIERAWFSALRNAVGARHDHEKVLELDPNYTDAKLVVGAHNYVTGSLPWGIKVAVSMVGLSGNKERGFKDLYEAANSSGETSVDAKVVLMLFLRRERRYDEAIRIARELIPAYPQNGLFALEEANLLRAAGNTNAAAEKYRAVWQAGLQGRYPGLHYEMSAVSLGDMLRGQKDYAGAAAAYELVNQLSKPDNELLQKANLSAGEMYDVMNHRDLAMKKYEAVIAANSGTPPAESARKYMKEAYRNE
ncbi:MAG TPA: tetratricopeptide repeat protein [Terriglobales bacterium]|nr:tetratricopeptide repeat protein [Terriglobales bacterium]